MWIRDKPRHVRGAKHRWYALPKGKTDCRWYSWMITFSSLAQSGNSEYLKELRKVNYMELGKCYDSQATNHWTSKWLSLPKWEDGLNEGLGISTARKRDESEHMGGRRKRMPHCNRGDRCICINVKACPLPTGEQCRNNSRKLKELWWLHDDGSHWIKQETSE